MKKLLTIVAAFGLMSAHVYGMSWFKAKVTPEEKAFNAGYEEPLCANDAAQVEQVREVVRENNGMGRQEWALGMSMAFGQCVIIKKNQQRDPRFEGRNCYEFFGARIKMMDTIWPEAATSAEFRKECLAAAMAFEEKMKKTNTQ